MEKNINKKAWLIGLGFDCNDGHVRVAHGKNFRVYGGSENTHNLMLEKAIKINEQLDKKGKTLENISENEFFDIASKAGLNIHDPDRN
jgi:hypothetical protein